MGFSSHPPCAAMSRKTLVEAMTDLNGSKSRMNYIKACRTRRQDNDFCFLRLANMQIINQLARCCGIPKDAV